MLPLEDSKSPEEWCAALRARGIKLSARTLRSKAREYGEFFALGRLMLLNAEHIHSILEAETAAARQSKGSGISARGESQQTCGGER